MSDATAVPVDPSPAASAAPQSRRAGVLALVAAAGVMILSLGALVVASTVQADFGGHGIGARAEDFSLRNATRQRVTLSELTRDQPVLLVFGDTGFGGVDTRAVAEALRRVPSVRLVVIGSEATPSFELAQVAAATDGRVTALADPDGTVAARYGMNDRSQRTQAALVSTDLLILDQGDLATCLARLPAVLEQD